MERVLRTLEKARPYSDLQLGSIRPDYLIPNSDEESFRICEINARFMFNGFFIGTWMSCANKGNSFPEEYAATTCSNVNIKL